MSKKSRKDCSFVSCHASFHFGVRSAHDVGRDVNMICGDNSINCAPRMSVLPTDVHQVKTWQLGILIISDVLGRFTATCECFAAVARESGN